MPKKTLKEIIMRAVFVTESLIDMSKKKLEIAGENARHLIVVARIKKGEDLLILNGNGIKILAKVEEIKGKKLVLSLENHRKCLPENNIDLVAAVAKKDSYEAIIRLCVELGIGRLYPIYSQYSQRNYKHTKRISKLIESAMIQSNNPFYLQIMPAENFKEIDKIAAGYNHLLYFSSHNHPSLSIAIKKEERILAFIGPEGGLSLEEEKKLERLSWQFVHLSTCILRCPTAVPAAVGYMTGRMLENSQTENS